MFCVIQEINLKKQSQNGGAKGLEVTKYNWGINGVQLYHYNYRYTDERFERPITKAYKISLHESYRENGKVKKRQYSVGTISYYHLLEYGFYDCCHGAIEYLIQNLSISEDDIYNCILEKLDPLQAKITKEFEQTEEFKTNKKNKDILDKYREAKETFKNKYNSDGYDYCYNIYGELMNKEYLQKIIDDYKASKEYQKQYEKYKSNYNRSSYTKLLANSYADDERTVLKKFYKALAMKYHPDANKDIDTTKEMTLLNKLKTEWEL